MTDVAQDTFQVWDPKKLIRQSRDRRMFLFELYLVFSKEVKDSNGKSKYLYKMKMLVSPPQGYFLLIFLADQRAAVASRRATNLATHLSDLATPLPAY
jgi:hypothetical protein